MQVPVEEERAEEGPRGPRLPRLPDSHNLSQARCEILFLSVPSFLLGPVSVGNGRIGGRHDTLAVD